MRAQGETEFERVVAGIYQTALDRSGWERALVLASDYLGATGGMLVFNDFSSGPPGKSWITIGRLRPDLSELYLARHVDNVGLRAIVRQPGGVVYSTRQLVGPGVIARTEWHADILAPQGIRDILALPHLPWHKTSQSGGLGFTLDARGADDVQARQARFDQLAPHFARALDLAMAVRADAMVLPGLFALIDAAPQPALLLDAAGTLCHANPQAEALLDEGDGLGRARDCKYLQASRPGDSQRLATLIGRAIDDASNLGRRRPTAALSVRLARPSGRPDLAIYAVPLPAGDMPYTGRERFYIALYVLQPGPASAAFIARALPEFGALFELTAAEQRVAALVGAGLGLPETARHLGISLETARTHLRRCFAKTGTSSQAGLARLLAQLPSPKR